MANTKSALKRVRQTRKRTVANRALKSRVKTSRRSAEAAIETGDADSIESNLRSLFSAADRAAKNGVLHKNAVSRIKRRYTALSRSN